MWVHATDRLSVPDTCCQKFGCAKCWMNVNQHWAESLYDEGHKGVWLKMNRIKGEGLETLKRGRGWRSLLTFEKVMASSNLTYYIPEPWNQWDLLKFCPGEYFNSSNVKNASSSLCEAGRLKLDFYNAPAWVNLASALIALVGCVLILFTYHSYASFRTGSRKVATCLAFSNMFLALGSILGSLNYLVYRYQDSNVNNETASCTAFAIICQVQAFITWTSALASFIWTVILALYLYLALARGSSAFFNYKYCWWSYYALSFAVPMFIIGPIEGSGFLGYSPYGNGGGCFITTGYVNMSNESNESSVLYAYTDASTGLVSFVKGLEVFAYVLVIMLFSIILCKSKRSLASSSEAQNNNEVSELSRWNACIPCW